MKRRLAAALVPPVMIAACTAASVQAGAAQCGDFMKLRDVAQEKATAVREAAQHKAERNVVCGLVQNFYAAETAVVTFLESNKPWCNIPEDAIQNARTGHEQTAKFRDMACNDAAAPSPQAPTLSDTRTEISVTMRAENGTYVVPVVINEAITLNFIVDSGAADVSIPADVVMTLIRTGTLGASDFLGEKTYMLADGTKVPSQTFRIRTLKIGGKLVENVEANVASVKGALLLGQSFLSRFKSWSIDNARHALVLR